MQWFLRMDLHRNSSQDFFGQSVAGCYDKQIKEISYLRGGGGPMFKKLFRFPFEVVQNSVVSTQILANIIRSWLKECDYHKIQRIFDRNYWKLFYFYCKFTFSVHMFIASGLAVISYRPSSFIHWFKLIQSNA